MIARIILALIIAVVVWLFLAELIGPILTTFVLPVAVLVGGFFIKWGWLLGTCAGVWFFLRGGTWATIRSRF